MGWVLFHPLCLFPAGSSSHPKPRAGQGPLRGLGGCEELAEAPGAAPRLQGSPGSFKGTSARTRRRF